MHCNYAEVIDVTGNVLDPVFRREPNAQRGAMLVFAVDQAGLFCLPYRNRNQQRANRKANVEWSFTVNQGYNFPCVVLQATLLDDLLVSH